MMDVVEHKSERETKLINSSGKIPIIPKAEAESSVIIEEFEPPYDWDHDDASDTLILMVPGFRKEQLKVEVTSNCVLRLSGERKISEKKWRRFKKEIPIPNSDITAVTAKFKPGIVYVTLPKLVSPQQKNAEEEETQKEPPKKENGKKETGPQVDKQSPKIKNVVEPRSEAQEIASHVQEVDKNMPKLEEIFILESSPSYFSDHHSEQIHDPKRINGELVKIGGLNAIAKEKGVEPESEKEMLMKKKKRKKNIKEEIQTMLKADDKEYYYSEKKENGKKELREGKKKSSFTLEMLSRLQIQEFKNEFSRFVVDEVKNRKKLCNLVFLVFFFLLFGIYLNNKVKSSFGGCN